LTGADGPRILFVYPSPAVRLQAPQGRHQLKADPGDFSFVERAMPTAVAIDGELLLRRFSSSFAGLNAESPDDIAIGVTSIAT